METPTTEEAEGLLARVEWRHSGRKAMRAAMVVVGILGVLALLATAGVKLERLSQFHVGKSGLIQLDLSTDQCFSASTAHGGYMYTPSPPSTTQEYVVWSANSVVCGSRPAIAYIGKAPIPPLFALPGDQRTTYKITNKPGTFSTTFPTASITPAPVYACAVDDDVARLTGSGVQSIVIGNIVNPELGGCCWMPDANAWAPDFGAASNIDEDDGAMPVADADACGSICAKDQRCQCAVYYEHIPVQWGHGNKKCWRRTTCNTAGVHKNDVGYQTCILSR